jgi:hypothetical protein
MAEEKTAFLLQGRSKPGGNSSFETITMQQPTFVLLNYILEISSETM